jgi:hypothetical protein
VHVVFSSHLDVGFTSSAAAVLNEYFTQYLPLAVNVTSATANSATPYTWMTHAYVLSLFFDCPPAMGLSCPSFALEDAVRQAVIDGRITFHAFPFNAELEFYTEELLAAGVQVSQTLATQLKRRGGVPRVISQRDVPGTSIGVIPVLKRSGVIGFSIGANGAAAPARVPPISRWRLGNDSLYLMFHPGNYGGDRRTDAVIIPGLNHSLSARRSA